MSPQEIVHSPVSLPSMTSEKSSGLTGEGTEEQDARARPAKQDATTGSITAYIALKAII